MSAPRYFIAIHPPDEALADLAVLVSQLDLDATNLRPVTREQWHITATFLGELSKEQIDSTINAMERAARSAVATSVFLSGGGRFENGNDDPIWIGLRGDVDGLHRFVGALRRGLRAEAVPYDDRALRPHLTLARPGDRLSQDEWDLLLARLDSYVGPDWRPASIELLRSGYPIVDAYAKVASAPLGS